MEMQMTGNERQMQVRTDGSRMRLGPAVNSTLAKSLGLLLVAFAIWVGASDASLAKQPSETGVPAAPDPPALAVPAPSPEVLGFSFVNGSASTLIIEKDGKKYLVDLATHNIKEVEESSASVPAAGQDAAKPPESQAMASAGTPKAEKPTPGVYEPGDDFLFSLPTGRRLERHGFYVNFNHRFAFNPAFTGKARGHLLLGLDDYALASFGFRYGLTKNASVEIYRSPSVIGRPIQLSAGYNLLDEHDGKPFNAAFRFSVEGQNDFSRNFTTDFEGIFSRSITGKAQIYFVPTLSLHDRPLAVPQRDIVNPFPFQPCSSPVAADVAGRTDIRPCANTFSLGVGGALDIRPTVALVAEVIPTLVNGAEMGIHRPAFSFGIQKKIWRHAFTFGFSTSPGTTVSQRAGTRATMLGDPSADTPSGLFVGFDLTRQIF
ncbi:MAG: DUF5777 family beta-barrel protein [Acidobacteriia bacterium]|nr:DUF5777 family beta-barrel protein [Terriglobia bacterium]